MATEQGADRARLSSVQWTLAAAHAAAAAIVAVLLLSGVASAGGVPPAWPKLVALAGVGVAAGAVLGFLVGREVKRRIGDVARAMVILAAGGLGHRATPSGDDEIGYLEVQFNAMAERLERQVNDLHRLAEENAALARGAARAAVLEERQRLARELHDAVSQALFSVVLLAAAARRHLPGSAQESARLLADLEETAAGAQREMRALILELRPADLEGRSLRAALEDLLRDLTQRHGIRTELEAPDTPVLALSAVEEDGLFRIVQEAVSNTLRHAGAERVVVRLDRDAAGITLEVGDDGRGFAPGQPNASYGLASMRERAEGMGGSLTVDSRPGAGTRVRVRLPRGDEGAET
jgi:NarL family two-component system sensor histidine kinase LiaS